MTLIIILLAVAAAYCGGMWLYCLMQFLRGRIQASEEIEQHTFHLGLCLILASGFLGLILSNGG